MTTTLLVGEQELSKQMGDSWSSATTAAGATTSLVDNALEGKESAWITEESWAFLIEEPSSTASIYDERKITSFNTSNKTLTTLSFSEAPGDAINYEVHRLWSPSEKRIALIYGARASFPYIHDKIWDESIVSGNWLKDGSFELWNTGGTSLTRWAKSASTIDRTSTAYYFEHGEYSCKISGGASNINQSVTYWDDLKRLAGKSVTFTVRGWSDTPSCLRISINDGVNDETYSSYHDGDDAWTHPNAPLTVTQVIDNNPTEITFKIYHVLEAASETSYVDDARVISGNTQPRLYIANLGLAQDYPREVYYESSNYSNREPWIRIHEADFATENGYMYLPSSVPNDRRLRIKGIGYLDFLASGVSSTLWTATINIEKPQTDILYAEAMVYLCNQMVIPNYTVGVSDAWKEASAYWQNELRVRRGKHGMPMPTIPVKWR